MELTIDLSLLQILLCILAIGAILLILNGFVFSRIFRETVRVWIVVLAILMLLSGGIGSVTEYR